MAFGALGKAVKVRDFWLLFFSFFICGATTNGYIGTHFIAMCGDHGLPVFALFYGLDWVATVPPTVRLTNDAFGSREAPIVLGWIVAGHQIGAAFTALM
ncbi:MFS transporter (fragment) [Thiomonas sp. X19]